jgi:hypothetical protein
MVEVEWSRRTKAGEHEGKSPPFLFFFKALHA